MLVLELVNSSTMVSYEQIRGFLKHKQEPFEEVWPFMNSISYCLIIVFILSAAMVDHLLPTSAKAQDALQQLKSDQSQTFDTHLCRPDLPLSIDVP